MKDDNTEPSTEPVDESLKQKGRSTAARVSEDDAATASVGFTHMDLLRVSMAQADRQRRIANGEEVEAASDELKPGAGQPQPEHFDGKFNDLTTPQGAAHPNEHPVQPIGSTKDRNGKELVARNSPREQVGYDRNNGLPSKEEYVAAGYDEANYDSFIKNRKRELADRSNANREVAGVDDGGDGNMTIRDEGELRSNQNVGSVSNPPAPEPPPPATAKGRKRNGELPVQPIGSTHDLSGKPIVAADTPRVAVTDTGPAAPVGSPTAAEMQGRVLGEGEQGEGAPSAPVAAVAPVAPAPVAPVPAK